MLFNRSLCEFIQFFQIFLTSLFTDFYIIYLNIRFYIYFLFLCYRMYQTLFPRTRVTLKDQCIILPVVLNSKLVWIRVLGKVSEIDGIFSFLLKTFQPVNNFIFLLFQTLIFLEPRCVLFAIRVNRRLEQKRTKNSCKVLLNYFLVIKRNTLHHFFDQLWNRRVRK